MLESWWEAHQLEFVISGGFFAASVAFFAVDAFVRSIQRRARHWGTKSKSTNEWHDDWD